MNYTVEIWHDTTMWNEGFMHAREPWATVTVDSKDTAERVAATVLTGRTLPEVNIDDCDKAFKARTHPTDDTTTLTETDAVTHLITRINEWEGL